MPSIEPSNRKRRKSDLVVILAVTLIVFHVIWFVPVRKAHSASLLRPDEPVSSRLGDEVEFLPVNRVGVHSFETWYEVEWAILLSDIAFIVGCAALIVLRWRRPESSTRPAP